MTQKRAKKPIAKTPTWWVAENTAAWRKGELGVSQEDFAAIAARWGGEAMNRALVANVESHRREDITVRELLALALALEVSPADLLTPPSPDAAEQVLIGDEEHNANAVHDWLTQRLPWIPAVIEDPTSYERWFRHSDDETRTGAELVAKGDLAYAAVNDLRKAVRHVQSTSYFVKYRLGYLADSADERAAAAKTLREGLARVQDEVERIIRDLERN